MLRRAITLVSTLLCHGCVDSSGPMNGSSRIQWRLPLPEADRYAWRGQPASNGSASFWKTSSGVLAVDLETGRQLWSTALPIASLNAPNLISRAGIIAVADWWGVSALDASNGRLLWSKVDSTLRHDTYLDASDDLLYYLEARDLDTPSPYDAWVVAVELQTGSERWRRALFRDERYTIVPHGVLASNGALYVVGSKSLNESGSKKLAFVHAFDASDGTPRWQYSTQGEFHAASLNLTATAELLLLADFFTPGYLALRRLDGSLAWRVDGTPGWVGPSYAPVVDGGIAFGASGDRTAQSFRPESGAALWSTRLPASARAFGLCGRFFLVENQAVMMLERATGKVVASLLGGATDQDIPTSGFAVWKETAAIATDQAIVGFSCR